MNTGQEALEAQSKKLVEMDTIIKTVRDLAKSAESKSNAATSQVNDLKSKLAEVTKQVKAVNK
jgi:flagellar hook-associated protein FlgK